MWKGQRSVSLSLLLVFSYPDVSTHCRVISFYLSVGSYLQRQYGVQWSVFVLLFCKSLRLWHHTQLFAFSGAIRATAHVPQQVRACRDAQRVQECAAQRLAGSCSIFLWRLLSHILENVPVTTCCAFKARSLYSLKHAVGGRLQVILVIHHNWCLTKINL